MVRRATSAAALNQLLKEDDIFRSSASDGARKENIDCTPHINSDSVKIWTATEFGRNVGYVFFRRQNEISWEMHAGFLEPYRGSYAMDAVRSSITLMFQSDPLCRKINLGIPSDHRSARQMAVALGFEREGVCRAAFLRGGMILDLIQYGMTKDAWCRRLSIRQ